MPPRRVPSAVTTARDDEVPNESSLISGLFELACRTVGRTLKNAFQDAFTYNALRSKTTSLELNAWIYEGETKHGILIAAAV